MSQEAESSINYDITCYAGASFSRTMNYMTAASVAVDLTGYTVNFKIKTGGNDALVLTNGSGITLSEVLGVINVFATTAQITALGQGLYNYTLDLVLGVNVTRIMQGGFNIK